MGYHHTGRSAKTSARHDLSNLFTSLHDACDTSMLQVLVAMATACIGQWLADAVTCSRNKSVQPVGMARPSRG